MSADPYPLKDYVLQHIVPSKTDIDYDEPLFTSGLVDSFGLLDLLFFIREQYGVNIEDFEITDNNLDTLNTLAEYIESKR